MERTLPNNAKCSPPSGRRRLFLIVLLTLTVGCATKSPEEKAKEDFFTSGSPEADRRADTAVPGDGNGKGESKGLETTEEKRTLYDRLGGESGITAIVDDFLKRALEDPRVNWSREGVTKGAWFRRKESVAWQPTRENVNQLKRHFVQFISLASGGPIEYGGDPLKSAHADMQITKPEFDAAIGDLKATLDKLGIAPELQKELLSIFESTRPQIVSER
jgi:hemoglobin